MHQDVLYERPLSIATCITAGINALKSNKMPFDGWATIAEHSLFVKARILEAVGLNESNGYRLEWPIKLDIKSDAFKTVRSLACLVADLAGGIIDKETYDRVDVKGNMTKVTKLMLKENSLAQSRWFFGSAVYEMCMMLSIPEYVTLVEAYQNKQKEPTKEQMLSVIHKIQVQWGNLLNTERTLVLSGNPYDLLTLSQDAGYKSCVSFKSGSFSTVADYLHSENVLVSYIESPHKRGSKLGRKLIFVNLEPMSLWIGRQYGTWALPVDEVLKNELFKRLTWVKEEELPVKSGLSNATCLVHGVAYLDYSYGEQYIATPLLQALDTDTRYSHDHGVDYTLGELKPFKIHKGMCLSCGTKHYDDSAYDICNDCKKRSCDSCFGKNVERTYNYGSQTVQLCKGCLDSKDSTTCYLCKERFLKNHTKPLGGKDVKTTGEEQASICTKCRTSRRTFTCHICSKTILLGAADQARNAERYGPCCDKCFSELRECSWCKSKLHSACFSNASGLCDNCESRTFICRVCNQRHEVQFSTIFKDVCYSCATSYPRCIACGYRYDPTDKGSNSPIEGVCRQCFNIFPACKECGEVITPAEAKRHRKLCKRCNEKINEDRPVAVQSVDSTGI